MFPDLRPGVSPEQASKTLVEVILRAGNVGSGLTLNHIKLFYLTWVEDAEGQLRNVFDNPEVWHGLYSGVHWRIRTMADEEPRPNRLIELEVGRQVDRLNDLQAGIDRIRRWIDRSPGRCVVLDTNVLLHYVPPNQIDWSAFLDPGDGVRLVIPIRVVEELDEKKYSRDSRISRRARSVLSEFGEALMSEEPTSIRDGVWLEVGLHGEPRERPLDADWEILSSCRHLLPYAEDLLLVTGDTAMRIRSQNLGIETRVLPGEYLRSKDADE